MARKSLEEQCAARKAWRLAQRVEKRAVQTQVKKVHGVQTQVKKVHVVQGQDKNACEGHAVKTQERKWSDFTQRREHFSRTVFSTRCAIATSKPFYRKDAEVLRCYWGRKRPRFPKVIEKEMENSWALQWQEDWFLDERIIAAYTKHPNHIRKLEFDWDYIDGFAFRTLRTDRTWSDWSYTENKIELLRQCQLCARIGTSKLVQHRNVYYWWNNPDGDLSVESKTILCMGCWNKVRPISNALVDIFVISKQIRKTRRALRSTTQ